MEWKVIFAAIALATVVCCDEGETGMLDLDDFSEDMTEHFGLLSFHRSPKPMYNLKWNETRWYIKEQFEKMGLETTLQYFNTTVVIVSEDGADILTRFVEGCNVIGVSKGDSEADRIILGAHYDSNDNGLTNGPLRENGAGVALLLEVARAYQDSAMDKHYHRDRTTIFVAFDINNMEEPSASKGQSGVSAFVDDYLQPTLAAHPLKGVFVMESVANYNSEAESQRLTEDFAEIFPEADSRIRNDSSQGNFLAAITTQQSANLLDSFTAFYRRDRMARPFRLQHMVTASASFGIAETFNALSTYGAMTFWEQSPSLPTILLTDTRQMRDLPKEEVECKTDCEFGNKRRMEFLYHTYGALFKFLLEEQTTLGSDDDTENGAGDSQLSGVAVLGALLLTRLLTLQ